MLEARVACPQLSSLRGACPLVTCCDELWLDLGLCAGGGVLLETE